MIYFRTIAKPGTWDTAEQIGRDKAGDLVKIVHGVPGTYWDGRTVEASGFGVEDMNGNRLAWHFHPGAAEQLAADIARKLRQGVTIEAIRATNPNQGN